LGVLIGGAFVVLGLICLGAVAVTQFPEWLGGIIPAATPLAQAAETASATAEASSTAAVVVVVDAPSETPIPAAATETPTIQITVTFSPTPTPTAPAAVGEIVFVNDYGDAAELYVVRDTGGSPARLTSNGCSDTEPDWSPVGRIVWQSDCGGSVDLWVMNSNGSDPVNLTATDGLDERGGDWSPDGLQLLFEVGNGIQDGDLFLMDATGENRRALGVRGRAPAWSPSADHIAYMAEVDNRWAIHIYSVADGQIRRLDCPTTHCRFPEWSRDGLSLAVNDLVDGEPKTVYLLDTQGGGSRQLTFEGVGNGRPAYSPDGARIAFNFDGGDATNGAAIYWMFEDGSSPTLIVDLNGDDYQADWH
jgi:Tol biopolymer transport system component